MTQRELAEKLHTDQKYVWSLEAGKDSIILDRIFEIMRQTGLRMYMEIDTPAPEAWFTANLLANRPTGMTG